MDYESLKISKKKITYPVREKLKNYLIKYDRYYATPVQYSDLLRFKDPIPLYDENGNETLWYSVFYETHEFEEINNSLKEIYRWLKSDGDMRHAADHIIDSIDFCKFGNSQPFRIRIKNLMNDNYDYFYIKKTDASRVYGLELEQLLSPNHINFFVHEDTLVEEHIIGIPGDVFLKKYNDNNQDYAGLAKEFVKFNERCFIRLLGDMRSYNFVVAITPDFDRLQYRIRSIDFDQQSYEGRMNMYRPQFFKENKQYVEIVKKYLNKDSIKQYQHEERTLFAKRMKTDGNRIDEIISIMSQDIVSTEEKIKQLKSEIYSKIKDINFKNCNSMGDIVRAGLDFMFRNYQSATLNR